jgi:PEP-CTERM motif
MLKRSFLPVLAIGLLACSFGAMNATAGTVAVLSDAGTFDFTLTANGSGNVSVTYSDVSLTLINGAGFVGGPVAASLSGTDVKVTSTISAPPLTVYSLSEPALNSKTFGTDSGIVSSASLQYALSTAYAINPGFLNLSGAVTGVISPDLETTGLPTTVYNFAPFGSGGTMALTYQSAGVNFASVIAHGGTVVGSGGFSEITTTTAVPEPNSMALLGIGMTCYMAFRRYFVRPHVE